MEHMRGLARWPFPDRCASCRTLRGGGVDIAGNQFSCVSIGTGDEYGWDAQHICCQARGDQVFNRALRWHEYFATHVPAFFLRRELIFKMHACRTRFDHCFHEFEHVQRATEACLGIRHDRRKPVDILLTLCIMNLVGSLERVVNPAHNLWHAVRGVQALVGVHLPGEVGICGNLPAAEIDRLQSGLDLLHCLIAGHCAQGRDVGFRVQEVPQPLGAHARQRIFDLNRPA